MKLLLIDNYDSFTYNLEHYFSTMDLDVTVMRNDVLTLKKVEDYDAIVISPGPGLPKQAGISPQIIASYADKKPLLGICLGAQAIAEFFGAELYNQEEVAHGIQREVVADKQSWLFKNLKQHFKVGLYHSWAINTTEKFSAKFEIVARRESGTIMAFEHPKLALAGIQFHPESIMTEQGKEILLNWIERAKNNPGH